MRASCATTGITRAADRIFQREEGMFHPGLADLFEPLGAHGAIACSHPIEILRNDRVISVI
jgi:hypothetical protein